MKLVYEKKKSKEEIFKKSEIYKDKILANTFENFILQGENFKALSVLLNNGYRNKIDLVYIDPPFATTNDFIISENRTSTISNPKNGIVAYTDKLVGFEYLEFIRERLLLIKELLSPEGSIYLHIDFKIGHYVKIIMDEVFGEENFINDITRIKGNPKNFQRKAFGNQKDLILFYAKEKGNHIFNNVTESLSIEDIERMFNKIDESGRRYNTIPLHAPGESNGETGGEFMGILPPEGRHWRTAPSKLEKLNDEGLIEWSKNGVPRLKKFADEHGGKKIQDIWLEFKDPQYPEYPTQKNSEMLDMIVRQSSNKDSIVLDCFCGSGSTLHAAQKFNRNFIGADQSQVAIDVATKKLNNFELIKLCND
ncbi:site-specific DNA-methyltransferase [Erysipelothrix rhusiopathiae]|nr:site-specific DNA-methyltransferase [Erysipelothrix rhusiopathiae]